MDSDPEDASRRVETKACCEMSASHFLSRGMGGGGGFLRFSGRTGGARRWRLASFCGSEMSGGPLAWSISPTSRIGDTAVVGSNNDLRPMNAIRQTTAVSRPGLPHALIRFAHPFGQPAAVYLCFAPVPRRWRADT